MFIKSFAKKILSALGKIFPRANGKSLFFVVTQKWPNLKNPKTFNEKTTWLKLNDYNENDLVSKCTDKYAVREYIKSKDCAGILNDLYGVYDNFDEINFDKLPNQFALKCVHGCAYNIIVKDKSDFDKNSAKKKIEKWQKEKYGYATSELQYTKIQPRIIVEKYLCDKNGKMPLDYKFYCMNGKVECILVCSERDEKLKLSYYTKEWKRLPYEKENWSSKKDILKPKNLAKMIECAEKLSQDFPFVRVDLYNDSGKIIFGELTFTPARSCAPYYSKKGNEELGKLLNLHNVKLQHVIASVNKDGESLYKKMHLKLDAIIANQNKDRSSIIIKTINDNKLTIVNTQTIGVGKNRNLGLAFANTDICILGDDDMIYKDDYITIIKNAFESLPKADLIIFDIIINDIKNKRQKAKKITKIKRINKSNYRQYGAARIAIKIASLKNKNVHFTEMFGGGTLFSSGEDTIFLKNCLDKKMKIYTYPAVIATVDQSLSSWYKGNDEKFFYDKGALLYNIAPCYLRPPLAFFYSLKFKSNISILKRFSLLYKGIRGYKKGLVYYDK